MRGAYHFTDITLKEDFRPLCEHQGARIPRVGQSSVPGSADAIPIREEEEMLNPTQLSLFLEEEQNL